ALCIDACDDVMGKLGREKGLISYATLADYNNNMAIAMGDTGVIEPARVKESATGRFVDAIRQTTWRSIIRPRTLIYFTVFGAIGLGMLTVLAMRSPLDLNVIHDRNPLYVQLQDGTVRNGYDVKILNMTPEPRTVVLALDGLPGGTMTMAGSSDEPTDSLTLELDPDKVLPLRLYVRTDPALLESPHESFTIVAPSTDGVV